MFAGQPAPTDFVASGGELNPEWIEQWVASRTLRTFVANFQHIWTGTIIYNNPALPE